MRLLPNLGSSSLKHCMDECEVATSNGWDITVQDFETPQKWHMLAATKNMSSRGNHTAWSHRPVTIQLYTPRHRIHLHAWISKKKEWSWQVKGNIGGWLILHTPNSPPTIIQKFYLCAHLAIALNLFFIIALMEHTTMLVASKCPQAKTKFIFLTCVEKPEGMDLGKTFFPQSIHSFSESATWKQPQLHDTC